MNAPVELPPYRPAAAWATVVILTVFVFVSFVDRQIVALLVGPIKQDLGLNDTQISLLQGLAFALFYSIAGIPLGMAADRYSRRVILFCGIMFFSLASAACGLMTSFTGLFMCRLAVGAGEAVLTPIAIALISENFPREKLGSAMGVYGASPYIGFGGGMALIGFVLATLAPVSPLHVMGVGELSAWQATFIVTALPGIPLAFLAFALRDKRDRAAGSRKLPGIKTVRAYVPLGVALAGRKAALAYFLAGFAMLSVVSYVTLAWTPTFFVRNYGWPPAEIGLWFGIVVAVPGISGSLFFGRLISLRMQAGHHDAAFAIPAAAALLSLPFFVFAYLADAAWMTLACIAIGYFSMSAMAPGSYSALPLITPSSARARVGSFYVFVIALTGAALGPFLVAFVTDHVFKDEMRVGDSLAIVLVAIVPLGCFILHNGRQHLARAVATEQY